MQSPNADNGSEGDELAFPENLSREEAEIFGFLETYPCSFDEIVEKSGFPAQQTNELLLHLELKGMVQTLPGKSYQKRIRLPIK